MNWKKSALSQQELIQQKREGTKGASPKGGGSQIWGMKKKKGDSVVNRDTRKKKRRIPARRKASS